MLIPRGSQTLDYNAVTVFNETGALIYKALQEPAEVHDLASLLIEKYCINETIAVSDVQEYLKKMLDAGIIEEA